MSIEKEFDKLYKRLGVVMAVIAIAIVLVGLVKSYLG